MEISSISFCIVFITILFLIVGLLGQAIIAGISIILNWAEDKPRPNLKKIKE